MSQSESGQPLINTEKVTDSQIQSLLELLLKETKRNNQIQENQVLEIDHLKKMIHMQKESLEKFENDNETLKQQLHGEKISKLKRRNRKQKEKIDHLKLQVANEIYQNYQNGKKLLETLESEEKLLKHTKKLQMQYEALRKSKLGQLTLFYWKKRKQIKRGF